MLLVCDAICRIGLRYVCASARDRRTKSQSDVSKEKEFLKGFSNTGTFLWLINWSGKGVKFGNPRDGWGRE